MNWITPQSRVLLENLIVTQLFKKFLAFYETWRFITVLTKPSPLQPILNQCTQSIIPPHYFLKIHSNVIFSSTLKSSKWRLEQKTNKYESKVFTVKFIFLLLFSPLNSFHVLDTWPILHWFFSLLIGSCVIFEKWWFIYLGKFLCLYKYSFTHKGTKHHMCNERDRLKRSYLLLLFIRSV